MKILSILKFGFFCPLFLVLFLLNPGLNRILANTNKDFTLNKIEKIDQNSYIDGQVIIKYKKNKINLEEIEEKEILNLEQKSLQKIKDGQIRKTIKTLKNKKDKFKEVVKRHNLVLIENNKVSTKELIRQYQKDESVEYAEPNYLRKIAAVPNDPEFNNQLNLSNPNGHDLDAVSAWNLESAGSGDVVVALIDSGTNYNHVDLAANMWNGTGCVDHNNNPSNCPNSGWDYYDNDNDPYNPAQQHGTMIAGVVGARTNNNLGMSGISYHNHLKIMTLRVGDNYLSTLAIINATYFAQNNGAKVINASYGGYEPSQAEKDSIANFNGLFIAAAGNNSNDNSINPFYPCNYDLENIICVASVNGDGTLSSFSNYGHPNVELAAPGDSIMGTYTNTATSTDTYGFGQGTSYSAPQVSGAAGLIYSKYPGISVRDAKAYLMSYGDTLGSLYKKIVTFNRLNLFKPLQEKDGKIKIIYRFWSPVKRVHFYTASENEMNKVVNQLSDIWTYEGPAMHTSTNQSSGTTPVYRFWSPVKRVHFYTASENEKNKVINQMSDIWTYEGIAYYAYNNNSTNTTPVYRFWSPVKRVHFYTASENEKNKVINQMSDIWTYEGIAWYNYP
ncbi:MAG: S8 family serine peptidase [Candidatus Moranbacteria bacterium]|nr:S8 family serine peptidase [Candidatus Moranbacteria bacterium]